MVSASQVQREPLERMQRFCGGNLNQYSQEAVKGRIYHRWQVYGFHAEDLMKMLFGLMSPRRQGQITACLSWYATRPGKNFIKGGRKICRNGLHPWVEDNIYSDSRGKKYCRACAAISRKRYWDKRKANLALKY